MSVSKAEYLYKEQIIFSHGYRKEKKNSNSIEYIDNAINNNFKGVEIDLYFIGKTNSFILTHDYYRGDIYKKNFVTLKEVFEKFNNTKVIFWLDLKNLNRLNYERCKDLLSEYNKNYNIDFFLESPNYKSLLYISLNSEIKTCFWIDKRKEIFLDLKSFYFVSMNVDDYIKDRSFYKLFSPLPINLFTVNSKEILKELKNEKNIKFIITDNNN